MIIVGSSAAKYWWEDWRDPSDLDVWVSEILHDIGDMHVLPTNILNSVEAFDGYATPDALYTIKLSHLGWDSHAWEKHKMDVLAMEKRGCKLIAPLYDALLSYWKGELGNKDFLSLSQNKEDFFTDKVKYDFDHDWLHSVVSYPNPPVYSLVLRDEEDVLIDKNKWDNLPFELKVRMFREEMAVIAMERWVIPSGNKVSWYKAWRWALRKTITSLTKGWATCFIVRNLRQFIVPDYNYFRNILEEFNMSEKVDLAPFEKLLELGVEPKDYEGEGELSALVYHLCEGEVTLSDEVLDVKWPDSNGRDYNDPQLKEERRAYFDARENKLDSILEEVGGYEQLAQEGGGEGGSEYCYGVFRLWNKVYRAEYSYYSYDGHHYYGILDTLREVKPKQKTVTVYE